MNPTAMINEASVRQKVETNNLLPAFVAAADCAAEIHWKMVKDPEEAADSQSTGMASNTKEEIGLRAMAQTRAY